MHIRSAASAQFGPSGSGPPRHRRNRSYALSRKMASRVVASRCLESSSCCTRNLHPRQGVNGKSLPKYNFDGSATPEALEVYAFRPLHQHW